MFKSTEGKNEIIQLYDQKLAELNIDSVHKVVETSFGNTNVIITGDPANPPIMVIHGSNGCAPIALETYQHLTSRFQVFAVDVLAQPNKSAATRLSMKDNGYGKWMQELIARLNLTNVALAGFSFGGLVILKTLLHDETHIKEVFLSAPAYIVNGNPFKAMLNIFLPMKRYMKTEDPKYVEQFLGEVFTERDEFGVQYLSKVFLHFDMDFTPVPTIKAKEARTIQTPITLIAAKKDVMFPGEKMIKRAKKLFPSLKKTVLLEHSKHVQNSADNVRIEQLILASAKAS